MQSFAVMTIKAKKSENKRGQLAEQMALSRVIPHFDENRALSSFQMHQGHIIDVRIK